MPDPVEACARCGRASPELRPLSGLLRWPAVLAMAFLHAGLWAGDLLSARLCRACRLKAGALSLAAALGGAAAVAAGAFVLLSVARS